MQSLSLIVSIVLVKLITSECHDLMEHEYKTIVLNGNYSTNITVSVNLNQEYIIHFPDSSSPYPYTVSAWSDAADFNHPIFIMTRQQREATSWEIPLLVKTMRDTLKFYNTSRTLCHNNINVVSHMSKNIEGSRKYNASNIFKQLSMSVSTTSVTVTPVTIRVEERNDFFVEQNQTISFTISPSQPRIFYYKGVKVFHRTVILDIDSQDNTCLTVSIQDPSCPVFDLNEDIEYRGEYETIDTRGGLIINENDFPNGFFVVFVAKGDDFDCLKKASMVTTDNRILPLNRTSSVSFKIVPNISPSEYWVASLSTLLVIAGFYIAFMAATCGACCWRNQYLITPAPQPLPDDRQRLIQDGETHDQQNDQQEGVVSENRLVVVHQRLSQPRMEISLPVDRNLDHNGGLPGTSRAQPQAQLNNNAEDILTASEQHDRRITNILQSSDVRLSHLATKTPKLLHRESFNYLWNVITVGVFYAVPAIQLAVTHQMVLNDTGNLDVCYYNFLCAHPFIVSDFNHVYSNIAYFAAGILFFIHTVYKHKHAVHIQDCGIPQHYGLYYAMAASLIMEGLMSACYHICPSRSNFQFDTSFMYVMAVLCIIKLYQNRHPDINAKAYVTFVILAAAIIIAVVGISSNHFVPWILFIVGYMVAILYLAVNLYYFHYPLRGLRFLMEDRRNRNFRLAMWPLKVGRCVLLVIAIIGNIILVNLGYYFYFAGVDFATYLLIIFMVNTIFYTFVYIIMKLVSEEKLSIPSVIYVIFAGVAWSAALYCFVKNSVEWKMPAAKSRERNTYCVLLNFYDYHDIWHMLSAIALFFSFMTLSTLDDHLVDKPRHQIPVF